MSSTAREGPEERPMLMRAHQMRSILSGVKDVTRRPVKDAVGYCGTKNKRDPGEWNDASKWGVLDAAGYSWTLASADPGGPYTLRCPYGRAGDRLWLREAHRAMHGSTAVAYAADGGEGPWTPSIFMERWMARIILEILSIRPERLHQITLSDFDREGLPRRGLLSWQDDFAAGWDAIYGERFPFSSDPFVWRIEFRRLEIPS